ncbi:MAG: DNA methyltransferase, partial [Lamprobacter sp.]|uniref:Eco57I restriction-modification methylase domain-containing protein n=1 Tax=Lamprobacter sp. TaxID=3100796 RepID=UPI002B262E9A
LFEQLRADNPAPTGMVQDQHLGRLLEHAQKILDRCLFICFCEDTRLLPAKVLTQALNAKSEGFVQVSRWQQLCGLFNAVDKGDAPMQINAYNGGLFAHDPALDALSVSDANLDGIAALAGYDFETDLNVNILGHIFEQSITDLELIRASIRGEPDQALADPQRSRRKRDGIFYTPELITRFMVERTIGGWLKERWAELEAKHRTGKPGPMANETRLKVLLDYLEVLKHIKILDPACGSGAFLVAAFDFLLAEYERVNAEIAALTGSPQQLGLFDLSRQILQQNLFGVDLNPESVEITKLSLWLKTAQRDKPLNNLDANIRCGNSLVEPLGEDTPAVLRDAFAQLPEDSRAFDWQAAFPEVFARGGFDVVIGNPPYVRQEALGPLKLYLAQCYTSYSGVADLYVYFYERGLNLLAPNGKLSYIVTNKWMR